MAIEDTLAEVKRSTDYKRDPDNREYVRSLEKKIEKIKSDTDFLSLDYIKDIKKRIKSILLDIRIKLEDEDDPAKRIILKADRDAYQWLLPYFSRDTDRELGSIEKKLRETIEV